MNPEDHELLQNIDAKLNEVLRLLRGEPPAGNRRLGHVSIERIARPARRPNAQQRAIDAARALDPLADERPDIEYGSEELPSGGSALKRS